MLPKSDTDLLLITAASGKQASALLPQLTGRGKRLRLNVSTNASAEKLQRQYPTAEVTTHDLADPHACAQLLEDVSACYLVTPGFHEREANCGINMISAATTQAKNGGPFKYILLSSVIFPGKSKLLNHDSKRQIEEYLIESPLAYTIVQPTHLMESLDLPGFIRGSGSTIARFWNPETRFSLVSTREVGEACAKILDAPEKHLYATYQLVGTAEPMSYTEAGRIIGEEVGRDVRLDWKSLEESTRIFVSVMTGGKPEEASFEMKQGVGKMFMYYNDKGLIGNSNVLKMLLGRKPMGYREWVKLNIEEAREGA